VTILRAVIGVLLSGIPFEAGACKESELFLLLNY